MLPNLVCFQLGAFLLADFLLVIQLGLDELPNKFAELSKKSRGYTQPAIDGAPGALGLLS